MTAQNTTILATLLVVTTKSNPAGSPSRSDWFVCLDQVDDEASLGQQYVEQSSVSRYDVGL